MGYDNITMRTIASYREHIHVQASTTKRTFETAYGSFSNIEEFIDSRPSDDAVYDYLQKRINAMHERSNGLSTIKTYFGHIKRYLHYRGIKLDPIDIKQSLKFPKRHKEEMRPLGLSVFQNILRSCSRKREMMYLAQSSSGMRIGEMLQIRKKDIHTHTERLMVRIPAKYTKTGMGRTTFLSAEAAKMVMPRLMKIDDADLVFGTGCDIDNGVSIEGTYLSKLQKRIGINDKYGINGRNVITTHTFRAYFITKVSRKDPNLAKFFTGQKGYMLQYDRLTDEEKLALYIEIEPSLLVSGKARDKEKIRNLENENSKVAELEKKNREFERMATGFEIRAMEAERKTVESERRYTALDRRLYELEDSMLVSMTKQSKRTDNGDANQCTCHNKPTKIQSPDYERGNRDVN